MTLVARSALSIPGRPLFTAMRSLSLDVKPPVNRWMKDILDKNAFRSIIPVLAARVPAQKTGFVLKSKALQRFILNLPRIRSVVSDPTDPNGDRLVLLRATDETDLSADARDFLKLASSGLLTYQLELDYDYWTADQILEAILPRDLRTEGSPTGFAMMGHLAHMNLNDEYLPYKHVIGQVILDKNKRVKSVVNKLNTIDNQFRVFKMELLAGVPDYIVEHHESDCRFTFDFTSVYWNSRLHTEHARLVSLFGPQDLIADVFAGVGPFTVPAAKKGCAVWGNDLNPESAKYLRKNVCDNRVTSLVRVTCEDGSVFIRNVAQRALADPLPRYTGPPLSRMQEKTERKSQKQHHNTSLPHLQPSEPRKRISHFVMNLPDSAITFLGAFQGLLTSPELSELYAEGLLPTVHCYCFTREMESIKAEADIRQRVEEKLGHTLSDSNDVALHLVRSVAPNKDMYCISFRLPPEVAFARR